jgi:group I intron endonuclease
MNIGYIYKTTNLLNNRVYIGKKHKSIFDPTYYGSGVILNEAIKKYGKENFKIELLDWADNIKKLNYLEKYYILQLTDVYDLYNISKGGDGGDTTSSHPNKIEIVNNRKKNLKNWHNNLSEEEKIKRGKKISASKKGKSNGHEGFTQSDKTIEKIRKSNIEFDRANNPEWKKAHSDAMAKRKGKPLVKKYKPVTVDDVEYPSIKDAMAALNIKHRAIFYKLSSQGKIKVIYK